MTKETKNLLCFDLEGPLSPQDNAYEVMGLIPNGHKIFETISKYDDMLVFFGRRKNYEPGDTLSLIIPFLLYHKITTSDIKKVSDFAKIVEGSDALIKKLREELNFEVFIISTSYEQHAYNIGKKLGVKKENIFATKFPIEKLREEVKDESSFSLIKDIEKVIIEELHPNLASFKLNDPDSKLMKTFEKFFWEDILTTKIASIVRSVKIIGGTRKVESMEKIMKKMNKKPNEVIVVGDSITDFKMLKKVKDAGGISVVFNGNEFSLPYGNIALATVDMRYLSMVIKSFQKGGKKLATNNVKLWENKRSEFEKNPDTIPRDIFSFPINDLNSKLPYFHTIEDKTIEEKRNISKIHMEYRNIVRGRDTAKLG